MTRYHDPLFTVGGTTDRDKPSALESFTVSGLAGHLAGQILFVPRTLNAPAPPDEPVSLLDHYGRVLWIDADVDAEINVNIRLGGESMASESACSAGKGSRGGAERAAA